MTSWSRRHDQGHNTAPTPWPPRGPFDSALLRLPKSKPEFEMMAHAALAALRPDGFLFVYGGNDEGIKSAGKRVAAITVTVETVVARGHGRIVRVRRASEGTQYKGQLSQWREMHDVAVGPKNRTWISYPGVFADGRLDAGTALLLATLTPFGAGKRILDYGCGSGIVAAHVLAANPAAICDLLDADTVALAAAAENVPGGRTVLGSSLAAVGATRYDVILSNPPIHTGIKEDHKALAALITDAPAHLVAGGALIMVVQRRIALDRSLAAAFKAVEIIADDGRFRVWRAAI